MIHDCQMGKIIHTLVNEVKDPEPRPLTMLRVAGVLSLDLNHTSNIIIDFLIHNGLLVEDEDGMISVSEETARELKTEPENDISKTIEDLLASIKPSTNNKHPNDKDN